MRTNLCLIILALLVNVGSAAYATSDVIDSRITFVFADDNIFAGSEDFSPSADIGQRKGIKTFFDNYDTKDSGQETKTNFVLYRRFSGPNPRIETEAGFVARFDVFTDEETGKPGTQLNDDGTFLQASYLLGDVVEGRPTAVAPRMYFLAFPFNADRMRLGYSYDITWGGNRVFPKNTTGAPGFKLGWEGEGAYAFAGLKTHRQLNEDTNDLDAVYGALGGFGVDLSESLVWEVNGGYFEKGVFPPQNAAQPGPLDGETITGQGASTQITFHRGLPIETSVDLRLYRNDPRFPWRAFKSQQYADAWSYLVSSEVSYITQGLRDPDVFGQTALSKGIAGDVNFRVKKGYLKFSADVVYRNLDFILYNVPSFTPYFAVPSTSKSTPESFVALGMDYYLERFRMNPGVILGYQIPATYIGDVSALVEGAEGVNTVVVRREGNFDILPPGQDAFDILSFRMFNRWDLSDGMSMIGEMTYTLDKNATRLETTEFGTVIRTFDDPNITNPVALALILQARF